MGEPRVAVDIRMAINPRGEGAVLLQFSDGWMVTSPASARKIAASLMNVADEVEQTMQRLADERDG